MWGIKAALSTRPQRYNKRIISNHMSEAFRSLQYNPVFIKHADMSKTNNSTHYLKPAVISASPTIRCIGRECLLTLSSRQNLFLI